MQQPTLHLNIRILGPEVVTGQKQAINQYNQYLIKAYRVGVQEGVAGGFGFDLVCLFIYCTYGLAVLFGGKMVLDKG